MNYKITKEELEAFAKKIYDEACYGYMDLKESFCNSAVQELIKGKEETTVPLGSSGGGYTYVGGAAAGNYSVMTNATGSTYTTSGSMSVGDIHIHAATPSNIEWNRVENNVPVIQYGTQFVQNETGVSSGSSSNLIFHFEHTPVLAGSVTGTVFRGSPGTREVPTAMQTFTVSNDGIVHIQNISESATAFPRVAEGTMNFVTGELWLTWNEIPGPVHIVVSYEYNSEAEFIATIRDDVTTDVVTRAQNENFNGNESERL